MPNSLSMDERMVKRLYGKTKKCRKGHINGPTAKICWRCGEPL